VINLLDPKFAKFHGVEREKIQWNPGIDENRCIGCGMCVASCGRGVYKYDYENRKSKVVNPNNCMVACQTCANLCPVKAISFAEEDKTREKAQKIIKDFGLLPKVKEELEARRSELEYKKLV
jgi:NAD-dependent dihydropyrimidine dehydrogenase PreA subunit